MLKKRSLTSTVVPCGWGAGSIAAFMSDPVTVMHQPLSATDVTLLVKVKREIEETLDRLKLKRKYACILIHKNNNLMGMIKKVKYYIAYGEIDKNVLEKLIKKRAESIEGRKKEIKIDSKKVVDGLLEGKKLSNFKLKEFFRLHPPRKGIKSKLQYPKGVLGDNKNISKLMQIFRNYAFNYHIIR